MEVFRLNKNMDFQRPTLLNSVFAPNQSEGKVPTFSNETFVNDFDVSIQVLSQGFLTWQRLQSCGIVKELTLQHIQDRNDWRNLYPNYFYPLHRGATCPRVRWWWVRVSTAACIKRGTLPTR